ncbi:MAG: hypothetical protein ABFD24_05145 [Anaerolineaceae bacterium]
METILPSILLVTWALLWILGGWWLSRSLFSLAPNEEGMVGLVVGLTAEVGLVNFIGRVLPFDLAIWIGAGIVFAAGAFFALRKAGLRGLKIRVVPWQWISFLVITYVFFLISRGLALYDDFAHLPTLSIMATGENPVLFALNSAIPLDYHYFVLMFGAQIMRLGHSLPWTAWDIAKSFTVAPAVFLGALWTYRVTRSRIAQWLGGAGVLFISGTRWLLLLLPDSIVSKLSQNVTLIGAGAASGSTLLASLPNPWPVDGQGSFPFPYAFLNGIFTSGSEGYLNVTALMLPAVLFALLLTASRWRSAWSALPTILLVSSLGLLTEIEIPLMGLAVLLITLITLLRSRKWKIPRQLGLWWLVWFVSGLIIAVQGGALSGSLNAVLYPLLGKPAPLTFQVTGLQLASPSIVSHHLGVLSLLDPAQIVIALIEIGPILLVLPLVLIWGLKAVRSERWFEATLLLAGILSLAMVFVHFSGSLRNTSRLYFFPRVCVMLAVPAVWIWASHRARFIRSAASILAGVVMFGGLVMLGVQFPNIKYHQFASFINSYDVKMEMKYWNKLDPGAAVFDPNPYRSATLFGRHTQAGTTWYDFLPAYENLVNAPDAKKLSQAGFSYAYFDQRYWNQLAENQKTAFLQPCVTEVERITKPGHDDWSALFDLRACR